MLPDFSLSMRARNRSPRTIQSYCEAAKLLDTYLTERGMPRNLRNIGREHVEAFIDDQLTRRSHASAAVRFRSLQQFFRWAKEDGQITASPMANMSPPSVTAPPVPIVKDDHFRLLLKTCEGKTFEDYRDAAILSLLFDTGARLSEITNLRLSDVDNGEMPQIRVMGKGRRARSVDYGVKTRKALRNYEKARSTDIELIVLRREVRLLKRQLHGGVRYQPYRGSEPRHPSTADRALHDPRWTDRTRLVPSRAYNGMRQACREW